jgi:DNA-binding transcriptional MocR family regulator
VELFEAARGHGISIAPGPIFSLTGKFRNAIRINAALWSPRTARAVQTLGELAHSQRDRPGLSA